MKTEAWTRKQTLEPKNDMYTPDDLKRIIIAYCFSCGSDEIVVLNGWYNCTICKTKWPIEKEKE